MLSGDMLAIHAIPGAPFEANCYLVGDTDAGEAILVDAPSQITDELRALAEALGVTVRAIVCTHGHFDHTMGLAELSEAFGAPVAVGAEDAEMLEHPSFGPFRLPFLPRPVTPDRRLTEGDTVSVGAHTFTVLHTPGHTPGGLCLHSAADGLLFTGDTLFASSVGRTDLPGGDTEALVGSVRRLLCDLPPETRVFPGHGRDTTIGREQGVLRMLEEL